MGFGEEKKLSMDWKKDFSENYLIFGPPKVGKTTIAADFIKDILDIDKSSMVYIINTDKGFTKPAEYIGLDDKSYDGRIEYFYVSTITRAIEVMNTIHSKVEDRMNPNDVVLFDLLSWVWEQSQKEFISELSGGDVVGFLTKAMKDPKKFGAFEGMQWPYVKKLDEMITGPLTRNPVCKIIAIARSKDVSTSYKIAGKSKDLDYELGVPDAKPRISHDFATIVKIEKVKTDDGFFRRFIVLGARDFDPDYKWYAYDTPRNFWDQLKAITGGKEITPHTLTPAPEVPKAEPITDEELVACLRESFVLVDMFTLEEVADKCGVPPEMVEEILKKGVFSGNLFLVEEGAWSFKDPDAREKLRMEKSTKEEEITEEDLNGVAQLIITGDIKSNDGASIEKMRKIMNPFIGDDKFESIIISLLDLGEIFEPSVGFVKMFDKEKFREKYTTEKNSSVEEEPKLGEVTMVEVEPEEGAKLTEVTVTKNDDGW